MSSLPIETVLPALRDAFAVARSVVLQAPPGAGKTTQVPLALLDAPWLANGSIVMLEPRRLAARAAAQRLAELRGERVGDTVGYRMRGDSRVGKRTRIEVVTEGILTRRLQRDPTLEGVGLLIFDEFHERSLDADLGLALALRTQSLVREELRILVMSATLDGAGVSRLLGGAPIISSEGRAFPVDTRYVATRGDARLEPGVVGVIGEAIHRDDGDILVFLPGAGEIRRVESLLRARDIGPITVTPLYGALSQEQQDAALKPDPLRRRKIVLATSIAETSLTIEGIRIVIDSGFSRVPRFSPRSGMTRLETVRVSQASADQRRGRAGRLGPGICYRLWGEHETHHLLAHSPPEILNADLAPLALDLAAAGVADPRELDWLDAPSPAAFARARELLVELGAIDDVGNTTAHGLEMVALPAHPRLAHMLVVAQRLGLARIACDVAALSSERDFFRSTGATLDADITLRIEWLVRTGDSGVLPAGAELDRDALRRVRGESDRLAQQVGKTSRSPQDIDSVGMLLALAYPDRVAQRREGERARFVLRNGRGGELTGGQSLAGSAYIVAAELDDRRPESRIYLAAGIRLDELRAALGNQIVEEDVVEFDDTTSAVVARRRERLGAIVLRDVAIDSPDAARISQAWLTEIRRRGIAALPWPENARRLRERMAFVGRHDPGWPEVSDEALAAHLEEWLAPQLERVRRWRDLEAADFAEALSALLTWQQRRALDELAPTHLEVPTGSRIPVDYSDAEAPSLAVRIQEVFGLTESPRVLGGRLSVTMQLLSPAHRPVQVTRDLAGFWRSSYFDVRKDLRGRYPKHEWPEDPVNAAPTRRAKPRR